jgi:hypothetical protein
MIGGAKRRPRRRGTLSGGKNRGHEESGKETGGEESRQGSPEKDSQEKLLRLQVRGNSPDPSTDEKEPQEPWFLRL